MGVFVLWMTCQSEWQLGVPSWSRSPKREHCVCMCVCVCVCMLFKTLPSEFLQSQESTEGKINMENKDGGREERKEEGLLKRKEDGELKR